MSNATRRPEGNSCAAIRALSDLRGVGVRGMTDKVAASAALTTVPLFRRLSARGLCPGRPNWLDMTSQSSNLGENTNQKASMAQTTTRPPERPFAHDRDCVLVWCSWLCDGDRTAESTSRRRWDFRL